MNIVFFGTPRFAVPTLQQLLNSSHRIVGVVTQPDRPSGRGQRVLHAPVKALAVEHGLPILQPDRLRPADVAEALRAWQPELGVVAAYGRIIPEHLIAVPRLGMINVHASLLPKYRGAAPVHRAVINGDSETGVTIMRIVKELDAGSMFAKTIRRIGPDETSDVVEEDLANLGARLLVTVVDQLDAGTAREEQQDPSQATYAEKLTKEEGLIDWSRSARAIHNQVRGLYPWPHAYTYFNGERLIAWKTTIADVEGPRREEPGTITAVGPATITVATGAGHLDILELQREGKRPMPVRDFLAGFSLSSGDRFSRP
jgi:methionyl-tRNA formyltransferase